MLCSGTVVFCSEAFKEIVSLRGDSISALTWALEGKLKCDLVRIKEEE